MTWFDHDTGSVWSQPIGEAIAGPLVGARLELLPSTLTSWAEWRTDHPDSFALAVPSTRSGFDLDDMSIVVEFANRSAAFSVVEVREAGVVNAEIGDVPIAVTVAPNGDSWEVYSRQLDDDVVVEFERDGDDLVAVNGTGRWQAARGLQTDGVGGDLNPLPGFTSFPNDYITFYPRGSVWHPDAGLLSLVDG